MEATMQSPDDADERGMTPDVGSGALTEQTYIRLRDVFLLVAAGCAVLAIVLIHVLSDPVIVPSASYVPGLVGVLFAVPVSALVSFVGAFLCALGCRRSRRLLRHAGVVLTDVAIMALMYAYCPWVPFDTEPAGIVYAPMWSPPPPREIAIDGVPLLAIGRLADQYMVVILASSILILLLTRRPAVKVG